MNSAISSKLYCTERGALVATNNGGNHQSIALLNILIQISKNNKYPTYIEAMDPVLKDTAIGLLTLWIPSLH